MLPYQISPRNQLFSRAFEAECTVISKDIHALIRSYVPKDIEAQQLPYVYRALLDPNRILAGRYDLKLRKCAAMLGDLLAFEELIPKNLANALPMDRTDFDYVMADLLVSARVTVRTNLTKAFHRACVKARVTPDEMERALQDSPYTMDFGWLFYKLVLWARYEIA